MDAPVTFGKDSIDHPTARAVLTEEALLSGMSYVDLNPMRANMCNTLGEPRHTNNGTMKWIRSELSFDRFCNFSRQTGIVQHQLDITEQTVATG
jgi:hypothetical protein